MSATSCCIWVRLAWSVVVSSGPFCQIQHEVADIAAYLLLLCHELDIDLSQAVLDKLEHNKAKYPADQVRGNSKKYDEYHTQD